ncbi:MAG: hypothetical protein KKD39_05275 [Candidatus Altiarchaeota archaeon]|nr:hypothetical protein [Candidatus Altiarchaeota archaeon]
MKHNVNYILLGLVLAILISMIGLVIYYYVTFEGLRTDYNKALDNLENVSQEMNRTHIELMAKESMLAEKEKILLEYLGELNISKQRETSISEHFLNEKAKAETLEMNLDSTTSERDRYASLYNKYYEESQQFQLKYTQTKSELDTATTRISRAKGDAAEISNMLSEIDAELSSLTNDVGNIKSKANTIQSKSNNATIDGLANDVEDYASSSQTAVSALNGYVSRIRSLVSSIRGS